MRFPKKLVEVAVSLYHKGLTLKAVKQAILEIFEIEASTQQYGTGVRGLLKQQ